MDKEDIEYLKTELKEKYQANAIAFKEAAKSDMIKAQAKLQRAQFNAYLDEGFDPAQAIQLVKGTSY